MRKLKEPLAYKEAEMLRREEDLMYREKLLQEELRKVTQQKAELTSTDELTLKRRLEDLQGRGHAEGGGGPVQGEVPRREGGGAAGQGAGPHRR